MAAAEVTDGWGDVTRAQCCHSLRESSSSEMSHSEWARDGLAPVWFESGCSRTSQSEDSPAYRADFLDLSHTLPLHWNLEMECSPFLKWAGIQLTLNNNSDLRVSPSFWIQDFGLKIQRSCGFWNSQVLLNKPVSCGLSMFLKLIK